MVQFFMLIPMVCLFFREMKKLQLFKSYFSPSICDEIQTLFFADESEVVMLG